MQALGLLAQRPGADGAVAGMPDAFGIPQQQYLGGFVAHQGQVLHLVGGLAGCEHVHLEIPEVRGRRFQEGAGGDPYRQWRLSKAYSRRVFLRQWEERLQVAWDPAAERVSGNTVPTA